MLIRLGILVAASVAVYAVKQITVNILMKPQGSTTEKEEDESILVLTDSMGSEDKLISEVHDKDADKELERLRSMVDEMEETQEKQERKLSVYYGMKEQELEIIKLKKRLQRKTTEINKFNFTIESLKAENKTLQEETLKCSLIKKQVEEARIMINELQQQIREVADQRKRRVMGIKEQLETIEADDNARSDAEIQKKLEAGNDLQLEATALTRRLKELQLENRVLAIKIVVSEARATAIINMTESEVMKSIRVQEDASREANEELQKQVENLQEDRFHAVEELVYQRWVNTCLRDELQSYETPCRKTSISDSQHSSTESNVCYNPVEDNTKGGKTRIGRKMSIIQKMKRWRRSMDTLSVASSHNRSFGSFSRRTSSSESGKSRRSSFSFGSFGTSALKHLRDRAAVEKSSSDSPDVARVLFRRRRVSFNDSMNTMRTFQEEQYADKDCGKIVMESEKPIAESDEVKTDWFTDSDSASTSDTGEPLLSLLVPTSAENNIDGSNATATLVESEILQSAVQADTSVQPRVMHTDAIFLFFLVVVIIVYLFLYNIKLFFRLVVV